MNILSPFSAVQAEAFKQNWQWFLAWGVALIVLGFAAMYFSFYSTILSVILLGGILSIAGVFVMFDAFQFWWKKWGGFAAHLLIGLLYLTVGIILVQQPIASSLSLTLILGIFYIVLGIFRLAYNFSTHLPQRGWRIFGGALTLLLGIFIVAEWPATGLFVIGLFIGIDLLFAGWIYTIGALAARKL